VLRINLHLLLVILYNEVNVTLYQKGMMKVMADQRKYDISQSHFVRDVTDRPLPQNPCVVAAYEALMAVMEEDGMKIVDLIYAGVVQSTRAMAP
jgi:hypothetical protein